MAITLDAIVLPDTLVWEDEVPWSPVVQSVEYSLTGALIVEEATRQAGRPITLAGQSDSDSHTGWMTRNDLLTLRAALTVAGAAFTLTLHDARTFAVIPRQDPLDAVPLPVYRSFSPANPAGDRWYVIRAIRLQTV